MEEQARLLIQGPSLDESTGLHRKSGKDLSASSKSKGTARTRNQRGVVKVVGSPFSGVVTWR